MNCVIVAGGRPRPGEHLYELSQGKPKALIEIAGRPMIAWVLAALESAKTVNDIAVVGLNQNEFTGNNIACIADQGNLLDNVLAGIRWGVARNPDAETLMLASSDLPALTPEIVDNFVENCALFQQTICYPFVSQETMESRFPLSKRTYVKFKDINVAGGDLVIIDPKIAELDEDLWRAIVGARKYPWRIASVIGMRTFIRFITRQMTLNEAEVKGQEILGRPVKALVTDHAEIAMDVDKRIHYELVAAHLGNLNLQNAS